MLRIEQTSYDIAAALPGEIDWEQIECVMGNLTTKKEKAVDGVSGIIVAR